MARFDVYRLKSGGLVLDLQSSIIDGLDTRVVVPLLTLDKFPKPVSRLNPKFEIAGEPVIMVTHMLGTVPVREIAEIVASLSNRDSEIVAATDFLFQGF